MQELGGLDATVMNGFKQSELEEQKVRLLLLEATSTPPNVQSIVPGTLPKNVVESGHCQSTDSVLQTGNTPGVLTNPRWIQAVGLKIALEL